ncbi:MAG: hypothetical protein WBM99_07575, partial [Psychromonas sp.]
HRCELDKPFLFKNDASIIAVACDNKVENCDLPVLDLNNPALISDFVCQFVKTSGQKTQRKSSV